MSYEAGRSYLTTIRQRTMTMNTWRMMPISTVTIVLLP